MSPALNAALAAAANVNGNLTRRLAALPFEVRTAATVVAARHELCGASYAALHRAKDMAPDADHIAIVDRLDAAIAGMEDAIVAAMPVGPSTSPVVVPPLALAALRAESNEERKRAEIDVRGEGWSTNERAELRPFEAVRIAARKAWAAAGFPFEG